MARLVDAAVFDVGETLVDETRQWGAVADWLGVPRLTMFGVLGGVIERGEHHHRAVEIVRPGVDVHAELQRMRTAGAWRAIERQDLYPDVAASLADLSARGFRLALAGNQPEKAETEPRALGLPIELVASSARWGVEKPSPRFFDRIVQELALPPARIAYVGDRVDNDVTPARAAGMLAIHLRRGPWGHLHATPAGVQRIDSLAELPALLS